MSARPDGSALKALLFAQFTGAFNDNAWKMIVTFLLMAGLSSADGMAAQRLTSQAFLVFTLPLIVFSIPAVAIADRVGKDRVIRAMKALEQLLMLGAAMALFLWPEGGWPALLVLGLMGAQSALFSPAKYGIIPELVKKEGIVQANGALELATFAAIILGTGAGGLMLEMTAGLPGVSALILTVLAALGYRASRRLPRLPAATGRNETLGKQIGGAWQAMRRDRALFRATFASVGFWFLLSLLGQDILVYTKSDLELGDGLASLPPALFGLGIGLGGLLAGRWARLANPIGLVPLAALLASLMLGAFYLIAPALPLTLLLAALIGLATGLIIVPLDSLIQARSPRRRRGAIIALGNVFVFSAMLLGSLAAAFFASLGATSLQILLLASLLAFLGAIAGAFIEPVITTRMLFHLGFRLFHRARFHGLENLPKRGPALLCPNHVSYLDWAYVASATERPIRFLVEKRFFEGRLSGAILRRCGAIPITTREGPRVLIEALKEARRHLEAGELVCLFPEGEISRTGDILPFRRGFGRLIEGLEVPVIPICLTGLESSRFAPKAQGLAFRGPVILRAGEALRDPAPEELREAVLELAAENEKEAARELGLLHELVFRQARSRPRARAYIAENGQTSSWRKAAVASFILAQELDRHLGREQAVAVLLPPSPAGAITNTALSLMGRVSVNLNYSLGAETLRATLAQIEGRRLITTRRLVERLDMEWPGDLQMLFIEDLMEGIGAARKIAAWLQVRFLPMCSLEARAGMRLRARTTDVATIIFSSGSTGSPKGVQLSHANVAWNARAALRRSNLRPDDVLVGCLPLFHSFGFMSLWLAATMGMATAFQANPLDAVALGRLVEREQASLLLTTPSFLQLYMKRCEPGQFASLKLVVVGAERLTDALARAFEARFGIRPLEGYGATECAPIIAMSGPDARGNGVHQPGSRAGSVGRPLPGVALRILDLETLEPVERGAVGLIALASPGLMVGYLERPDLDAEVMHAGFYLTGDLGRLDDEGFLEIRDRLSRFSKIGGEMVPHGLIEERMQEIVAIAERRFAVGSLPDAQKGEALFVLHTMAGLDVDALRESLRARGLSNLFIPRAERFFEVAELPLLGSGKLDLAALKRRALEFEAASCEAAK